MRTSSVCVRLIHDIICLGVVITPCLLIRSYTYPYQRGFFCDDETIRYPYKEDTVTPFTLQFVGLSFPALIIVLNELQIALKSRRNENIIILWLSNVYKSYGVFLFGLACSELITDSGKYTIGRLRPHFYSVCEPNIDCTSPKYRNIYVTDFECLIKDAEVLKEIRLSFPSGHSSFASYTMVYLIVYFERSFQSFHLIKKILQLLCVMLVWLTALSRVSDYKHHWSDVLAGLIIGTSTALINAYFVSNLFAKNKSKFKNLYSKSDYLSSTDTIGLEEKPVKLL